MDSVNEVFEFPSEDMGTLLDDKVLLLASSREHSLLCICTSTTLYILRIDLSVLGSGNSLLDFQRISFNSTISVNHIQLWSSFDSNVYASLSSGSILSAIKIFNTAGQHLKIEGFQIPSFKFIEHETWISAMSSSLFGIAATGDFSGYICIWYLIDSIKDDSDPISPIFSTKIFETCITSIREGTSSSLQVSTPHLELYLYLSYY